MLANSSNEGDGYFNFGRIIRECRRVAHDNGFVGDAFTDNVKLGTLDQELWIVRLLGLVDQKIARLNMALVKRIIGNIVRNSRGQQ